jgi:two-component system chemotaxis sensor kinase CheA
LIKKLLTTLLFVSVLFASKETEIQKVSLQLLWKHQFEFAGYYMAKEKGFYKEAGLEIDIKEYRFGTDITQDVINGKSDFGIGGSSVILDKIKGNDICLLLPAFQSSPFVLLVKKRDDIKTVSDLKGKKIMANPNQVAMAALNAMFKVNNLKENDFTTQKHSYNIDDLISGRTDAMSAYLSNEPYHMKEKGIAYTILDPSDYGFNFYDDILFTSSKLLKNDPKLVESFYNATKKGWDYAYSNIEESVDVIFKKYNSQNKTKEHLLFEAEELKKLSGYGTHEYVKFKTDILNQIVQTYNLLDLSKGKIDFDNFIYSEALYVEQTIDYSLLWKIALGIIILFSMVFYWNRKLSEMNKLIEKSKEKVDILLDNAGQGFLTFDKNFLIDAEYSKECNKLLGNSIENKDITKLIFNDPKKIEFFKSTILTALNETMEIKRNSYLSLLPKIILLNKKAIKLEYKILENSYFMMILTNITTQKKLEKKIRKEQEVFKMIVTVVSESEIFYDTKKLFLEFIDSKEHLHNKKLNESYRLIHTFKGTFSQLYMQNMVQILHKIESKISKAINNKSNITLNDILEPEILKAEFENTLQIISEILGKEFLNGDNYVKIDISNIYELQEKISNVLDKKDLATPECKDILLHIQNLSKQKLYPLLKPYTALIDQLAKKFHKDIEKVEIKGDNELTIDEHIKPFIKSLIHVFRNCVDHGIETQEERLKKQKSETGKIACSYKQKGNTLIIKISDDGAGIDKEKLRQKIEESPLHKGSLQDDELFSKIFCENISTKNSVDEISGRGMGMNAVKTELDKLKGSVEIQSQKDKGTSFKFMIPLTNK